MAIPGPNESALAVQPRPSVRRRTASLNGVDPRSRQLDLLLPSPRRRSAPATPRRTPAPLADLGPHRIISDRYRYDRTDLSRRDRLAFRDCFIYGRSINNIKIERWWGSLCQGRAWFWRVRRPFTIVISSLTLLYIGVLCLPSPYLPIRESGACRPYCPSLYVYAYYSYRVRQLCNALE